MPIPDPHASEPTIEGDKNLWEQRLFCLREAEKWKQRADDLTEKIKAEMGAATALVIDGAKVAYYRPSDRYASRALELAYPEMTAHYTHEVKREVFDVDLFVRAHPDLAEPYRIRAFVTAIKGTKVEP